MTTRRWVSGVLLLGVLLSVAGCSDEETSSGSASSKAASTSPASATPSPTAEELAEEAATTAFTELLRVTDAASRDPGARDWEPEIRRYAADPAAFLSIQSIRDMATLGLRQEGDSSVDVEVAAVDLEAPEGPTVRLAGCYDSQGAQIVNVATGEVVPPGTPPRYVWAITIIQYVEEPGEPWLVSTLDPLPDQAC
jgi:hypothetical protein